MQNKWKMWDASNENAVSDGQSVCQKVDSFHYSTGHCERSRWVATGYFIQTFTSIDRLFSLVRNAHAVLLHFEPFNGLRYFMHLFRRVARFGHDRNYSLFDFHVFFHSVPWKQKAKFIFIYSLRANEGMRSRYSQFAYKFVIAVRMRIHAVRNQYNKWLEWRHTLAFI